MVTLQFTCLRVLQMTYRNYIYAVVLLLSLNACAFRSVSSSDESELYFQQGLKAYYQGNITYAGDCLIRAAKKDKSKDAAWYYLSNIALARQDPSQALSYMEKALKADPDNYWYRLQQAKLVLTAGNREKGLTLYERLVKDYPNKMELLYDMVNLYVQANQPQQALGVLDRVEAKEGQSEQSVLMRFNLNLENDPQGAYEALASYRERNASPTVLTLLGDYNATEGRVEDAQALYEQALTVDPTYIPAVFGQAEMFRMKRQFDLFFERINPFLASPLVEASMKTDYLRQLLESRGFVSTFMPQVDTLFLSARAGSPADSSLAYMYTGYLVQTERVEQAKEVMRSNLEDYYPEDRDAWYQTVVLFYYVEDWPQAVAYADKALNLFPKDIELQTLFGMALWQQGRLEPAIRCFEDMLLLVDKNDKANWVQTFTLLGDLYHEQGATQKSFEAYEEVLKADPDNIGTLNNYAYFLSLENSHLEKALAMSKKTIEAEPNNSTYLDTYGWILHLLGRSTEAKDIIRQALAYGGNESAAVLEHYGDILQALNEPLMATVYWRQAQALEPTEALEAKIKAYTNP